MAADDPFKPIGRRPKPRAKTDPGETWTAIVPVPANAPDPPSEIRIAGKTMKARGIWTYRDAGGRMLGQVVRFEPRSGKQYRPLTYCQSSSGKLAWRWLSWPPPRPLYGIDRLAKKPKAPVIVAEGEKSADGAAQLLFDHVGVTAPNGALAAAQADWSPLAGRHVVIWPDADEAGRKYARAVVKALAPIAASVRVITPPKGAVAGWDAADALSAGWNAEHTRDMVDAAKAALPEPAREDEDEGTGDEPDEEGARRGPRERITDILVGLVTNDPGVELWSNQYGEGWVTLSVGSHRENWPILSNEFSRVLINRHHSASDRTTPGSAVRDAVLNIDARAVAAGRPRYRTELRITRLGDAIYIDLGDEQWRCVEVTAAGWRVIETPPREVKFYRPPSMQPLPVPVSGGSVEELRRFIPFKSDNDFLLYVGFLVGCFRGLGEPQVLLAVYGAQGSIKSVILRYARRLVDPNEVEIESKPDPKQDLSPLLKDSYLVCFDNVSVINPELSDLLCQVSTFYGYSKKRLYTNDSTHRRGYRRPQAFTGIAEAVIRGDLASRTLIIDAPLVPNGWYLPEHDLFTEFDRARPRILGALLDAAASALAHPDETPPESPRMADFVQWVWRARHVLGWTGLDFLAAYRAQEETAAAVIIEASPFARQIIDFASRLADGAAGYSPPKEEGRPREYARKTDHNGLHPVAVWTGTASLLLERLPGTEADRRQRWFPSNENQVRTILRRLQGALASRGIALDLAIPGHRYGRLLRIEGDVARLQKPPDDDLDNPGG